MLNPFFGISLTVLSIFSSLSIAADKQGVTLLISRVQHVRFWESSPETLQARVWVDRVSVYSLNEGGVVTNLSVGSAHVIVPKVCGEVLRQALLSIRETVIELSGTLDEWNKGNEPQFRIASNGKRALECTLHDASILPR